jgi:uncharacterized membrane protein YfcA
MIERSITIGVILGITALAVAVPVLLQMRSDERRLSEVWGHFIFIAGLLAVAAGYAFFADERQYYLAVGGLIAALLGLFIQHRDRDRDDAAPNGDVK